MKIQEIISRSCKEGGFLGWLLETYGSEQVLEVDTSSLKFPMGDSAEAYITEQMAIHHPNIEVDFI